MSEKPIKVRVGRPLKARLIVEPEPQLRLKASGGAVVPEYHGAYEVVPSGETQVLSTAGRLLSQDVTINPIPSNYGLITWNGSTLTVS